MPPTLKKMKEIRLDWTEADFDCPKVFTSWLAVDSFLYNQRKPKGGSYYKTGFTVLFEDGEEYTGRYDIGSDRATLAGHIRAHCTFHGGLCRPAHISEERYAAMRETIGEGAQLEYQVFLETHEIPESA